MELTFLGTGAAFAPDAHNASYILDRRVLIDAGSPGHVLIPRSGHSIGEIEAVVITHKHGDHTFGLPFVLSARAIHFPDAPRLTIVGPPGFGQYISDLLHLAWGETLHDLVWNRLDPEIVDVEPGQALEVAGFRVQAEEVVHVSDLVCLGYVFEKDGVRFGFSGDTRECDGLFRLVEASDHFLCEMTAETSNPTHLSRQAVERLVETFPHKRFYLTHLNDRTPVPGALIAEDGMTVELAPPA
ncbi:MAG TPA: ribonuclease Z [Candidatus Dormibacteraeota bacterium]|nr:ribonuclease Z [Candidatus Dormibacteraeota bacterium]